MKKQMLAMAVVLGLIGFAGARPALAQADELTVKVPFSFVAGNTVLPAGQYRMVADVSHPQLVSLCSVTGKARVELFTSLVTDAPEKGPIGFDFRKVGRQYVLTGFNMPNEGTLEVVLPVPAEQPSPARH